MLYVAMEMYESESLHRLLREALTGCEHMKRVWTYYLHPFKCLPPDGIEPWSFGTHNKHVDR